MSPFFGRSCHIGSQPQLSHICARLFILGHLINTSLCQLHPIVSQHGPSLTHPSSLSEIQTSTILSFLIFSYLHFFFSVLNFILITSWGPGILYLINSQFFSNNFHFYSFGYILFLIVSYMNIVFISFPLSLLSLQLILYSLIILRFTVSNSLAIIYICTQVYLHTQYIYKLINRILSH